MKDPRDPQRRRRLNRKSGDQRWNALPDIQDVRYSNPNRGACKSKIIALPGESWRQIVRVERWRRGKRSVVSGQHSPKNHRPTLAPSPLPSPPSHWHYLICPHCERKVFKLMTVLATQDEVNDAAIAEGWIRLVDARLAASRQTLTHHLATIRAQLIDRYGQLFHGRRLICRKCLGVRYGEVRKSRRTCNPTYAAERSRKRLAAQTARDATRQAESDAALRELFESLSSA